MKKMPEQVIYRKIQQPRLVCPKVKGRYGQNKSIMLKVCKECEFHRGCDDDNVACAFSKEGKK